MEISLAESKSKTSIWATGLAMFSMFFGAGNIVFPLALGQLVQNQLIPGILGLAVTAVLVPFLGLFVILLYQGDYLNFFNRIGKIPGFFLVLMILCLIGPFGGIPRCLAFSFSTFKTLGLSWLNITTFSAISCAVIYLFTFRANKVLTLLGFVLTPLLLLALGIIVVKGFCQLPAIPVSTLSSGQAYMRGFLEGYNTMDLLGAFFFSSSILMCLRNNNGGANSKSTVKTVAMASMIAAILLTSIYACFACLSAGFSNQFVGIPSHEILGSLTYKLLGPYAGLVASLAVAFACLTTEIALVVVFSEFLSSKLLRGKISYRMSLLVTLVLSFFVSMLQFEGVSAFLVPILCMCYPSLIVLCVLNIFHKMFGFKQVKLFFYSIVAISLFMQFVL